MDEKGEDLDMRQPLREDGVEEDSNCDDEDDEERFVPALRHVRWVTEYCECDDLVNDKEGYGINADLPGQDGKPAHDVAEELLLASRGEFRYPVILATACWRLPTVSTSCGLSSQWS